MSSEPLASTALPDPGIRPINDEAFTKTPHSDRGFERECVISRRDLEVLLRGAESEREIGYRNLSAGVALSSGLGLLSTVAPSLDELLSAGANPMQSLLLILLSAITLASSTLTVFFHRRLQNTGSGAYRLLDRHIRTQLDQPADLSDPRHWP